MRYLILAVVLSCCLGSSAAEQAEPPQASQAMNLAATFGTTYSSGALVFGGGDSQGEQNKYYRAIIERKDAIQAQRIAVAGAQCYAFS